MGDNDQDRWERKQQAEREDNEEVVVATMELAGIRVRRLFRQRHERTTYEVTVSDGQVMLSSGGIRHLVHLLAALADLGAGRADG